MSSQSQNITEQKQRAASVRKNDRNPLNLEALPVNNGRA